MPSLAEAIRPELPSIAEEIIEAIREEVAPYRRPLKGEFGRNVRVGVEFALGRFLDEQAGECGAPGVSRKVYVELGRGQDYAWSATSAGQDIVDTYAVDLCNADGSAPTIDSTGYMYAGKCQEMEKLARDNTWVPNAADQSPPGSE